MNQQQRLTPLAIVGYGCIFPPHGYTPSLYWDNILAGIRGIASPPPDRWRRELFYSEDRRAPDKTYCGLGGFVEGYSFSPEGWPFSPEETAGLTRTHQLILDASLQAISMAGYCPADLADRTTGLFVGNMLGDEWMSHYSLHTRAAEIWHRLSRSETFARLDKPSRRALAQQFFHAIGRQYPALCEATVESALQGSLAGTVGRMLKLTGPTWVCDAACATGLLVVEMAARHLQDHSVDLAVACGAMGNMNVTGNVCFAKIGGLSGVDSLPLDHRADGLIPGEGVGAILLKRLDDAVRDRDRIVGVVRGIASRCDGKGKAIYAPASRGQVAAMRRALTLAGWQPEEVQYVETHATGTPTGDKVEMDSLREVFLAKAGTAAPALGSVKSLIGHTFSAAGMANLIKILLGFNHRVLPPTHHYEHPAPGMHLDNAAFQVNTRAKPWPADRLGVRRAMANAFGFGGINTSICVEDFSDSYHCRVAAAIPALLRSAHGPIAIIGIGCLAPGIDSWPHYCKARTIQAPCPYPPERWQWDSNPVYNPDGKKVGHFISIDFPFKRFRIPPKVLAQIDRSQLIALMAADEALQDAGVSLTGDQTGVFVGSFCGLESGFLSNLRIRLVEYVQMFDSLPAFQAFDPAVRRQLLDALLQGVRSCVPETTEDILPGYMDNIIGGRIANLLDIRGVNAVIDAGEASFAAAVDMGRQYLEQGECAAVLVGGVHANMTPEFLRVYELWSRRRGVCLPAEGAVFFVLRKVADLKGRETVYGLIASGVNPLTAGAPPVPDTADRSGPFYFGAHGGFALLDQLAGFSGKEAPPAAAAGTFATLSATAALYRLEVRPHQGAAPPSPDAA